ncbi:50S ribosomal protein L31e [Candidatus Woesearchaeota archaeon]|nr:50S ribosomal protein L31e [Candidatus Woesearchaeota archaeon]
MAEEKIFTIGLRKEFLKKPKYRRAKKAVTAVKEFIIQHLKVKEVKIGPNLNSKIWERGKRNPPSKIKVKGLVEEGIAYVELPEFEFKPKPKEEKKLEKTSKKESVEVAKEEQKKEQEKESIKELAHEEKVKEKKEHHHEPIEVPHAEIKQPEKDIENKSKKGRVVGSTGKKGAKQAKP